MLAAWITNNKIKKKTTKNKNIKYKFKHMKIKTIKISKKAETLISSIKTKVQKIQTYKLEKTETYKNT